MKFPKEYEYRGGQRDLAKVIGVTPAAVNLWKASGRIPRKRVKEVAAHLKELRAPVGEARKLSDIVEELLTALKAKGL